jgi:predicted secreted protein
MFRHFELEAVAAGTADLEIDYFRPWESDKPPARKFKLRIIVRSASGG